MEKFTTVTSKIIPLPMKEVDTDLIIPAQFLTSVSKEGYGANLFRRLRDSDPNFPLNLDRYKGAQILVADDNFGCGSSREHAVWAILGAGIRVVICKSFADIFTSNSGKNGLLLVQLPEQIVDGLLQQAATADVSVCVNLEAQEVKLPDGRSVSFVYDEFRKHCLLQGLDDLDYMLAAKTEIERFKLQQEKHRYYRTEQAIAALSR